ncbi:Transcriptional regulatory protein QseB [Sporomusa aerivorans]
MSALSGLLRKNGYLVDSALNGKNGFEMACTGTYDIIILNRTLPEMDGLSFLKEFRGSGYNTPVLILSGKDSPQARAEGLNLGADDYLGIPFAIEELLARVQALVRRKNTEMVKNELVVGNLKFNPRKLQITEGNSVTRLTLKEALLLELFMSNSEKVVTKEQIAEKLWGFFADTDIAAVNLYVHYLRKKIKNFNLRTIRGIGYSLEANSTMESANN